MNVLLLVIDSMRAKSIDLNGESGPTATPFLRQLARESIRFTRAYATECWTLPTHCSIFTGRLPSEHGAHFQTMAYQADYPTVAEILSDGGYYTEIVTRNSIFDNSLPGITRGFVVNTRVTSSRSWLDPMAVMLALSKPRFRRQIVSSGFFHPRQVESRAFCSNFARATLPADREALLKVLESMKWCRDTGRPYFVFCNLYDVHAPYSPSCTSILRPFRDPSTWWESMRLPVVLPRLGSHAYLRRGFSLSDWDRLMLLGRYHTAIELADSKLRAFYEEALDAGLLDDTLLVVTSDHGEAFGDHDLYLHDASVYDVHLHVPLLVRFPDGRSEVVDDVVSTRHLFDVLLSAVRRGRHGPTVLDAEFRAEHPIAIAEHFFYPHVPDARPCYRSNQVSAIVGDAKLIVRENEALFYDLSRDGEEMGATRGTLADFIDVARGQGAAPRTASVALEHLRAFQSRHGPTPGEAAEPREFSP